MRSNATENIDLRAEGLPDHAIRQRQGKIVNVAAGNAIPVLAGCATPTGTRLFNTKFCMSTGLLTLARMTT